MIKEKMAIAKEILEVSPKSCGDNGVGHFLNAVASRLYKDKIDFTEFRTETWERTRRKVLADYPHLDLRTPKFKKESQDAYKREVA
jgi:hypothetical protein